MSFNDNNRSFNRSDSAAASGRSGGGRRGNSRRRVDTSTLPLEQGIICNLKDGFGFIHCADRPEEIFFHYSEVTNCHPEDLQVDTEVEFRVGQSEKDSTKLAALAVETLETGTVVWETEEQSEKYYQGLVERSNRDDSRRGGNRDGGHNQDGSIEVLAEDVVLDEVGKLKGWKVRFRPDDVIPDKKSKNNRLFSGDLVRFRIFLDRRTKQKYARYITIVQTEKERARKERERKLLESAVEEEGMIISLNNGYGFLKTNKRRQHLYFHYSNFILPVDPVNFELRMGQEVKFLVVCEVIDGQNKSSARRIECLPKGSVQFHTHVAKGVKGTVTLCPQPPSAGNNPGYADDKDGCIRLLEPLTDKDADGNEITITDVSFEFNDAPGGVYTFQQRGTTINGLWIVDGDILLFDVVKELADGSYQAAPTMHTLAVGGAVEEPPEENPGVESNGFIRLAACSLVSRAEGTMHTVKLQGGYGFISFAERPIDVHFNTYNLMPEELASDLRKQLGYPGDEIKLEVGVGVQFDICAHGTVQAGGRSGWGGGGGRQRGAPLERENIKAHRILTLPQLAVTIDKVLGIGVKGVVKSADTNQLYAGFVDFDDDITLFTFEERHPLVAKMIDAFIEESSKPHGRQQLVFRDVLSLKDDEVVVGMINEKGKGVLTYDHIPVAGMDPRSGRLCIKRVKEGVEQPLLLDEGKKSKANKQQPLNQRIRNLHFDKSALIDELKEDLPPSAGDVIVCDVVQSRRTGKVRIENLKIIDRCKVVPPLNSLNGSAQERSSGVGVVQNVVPKSNFGFISVLDEMAATQEFLFFSLSEGKNSVKSLVRKGDEVKFDIGVDSKTGKRMALNVEVVAKGTIPSKPSKNACRGIILMEPSHTSLSDTPLRKKSSGDSLAGRWGNTKDNARKEQGETHETGVILLIEDKTGMFSKKPIVPSRNRSGSVDSSDEADDKSVDDTSTDMESKDDDRSVDSCVISHEGQPGGRLSHLYYNNGAIAIHGTGSGCGIDASGNPRRGDIVTFAKARKGMKVRDVRIESRRAAMRFTGRLENIEVQCTGESKKNAGSAKFVAATERQETYEIDLAEVVSCDASLLQENQQVEGILHEGVIYGICRTSDLYLESKLSGGQKERPRLNLAIKKDRGGRIMAQSMVSKGPDGTNGFAPGWTTRTSLYANMNHT